MPAAWFATTPAEGARTTPTKEAPLVESTPPLPTGINSAAALPFLTWLLTSPAGRTAAGFVVNFPMILVGREHPEAAVRIAAIKSRRGFWPFMFAALVYLVSAGLNPPTIMSSVRFDLGITERLPGVSQV